MKKTLLSLVAAFAVSSSLFASDTKVTEDQIFCAALYSVSQNMEKILIDVYTLQHHVPLRACEDVSQAEWKTMVAENELYAFLTAFRFSHSSIENNRMQKACTDLTYEILIDRAYKNKINTVEGMKSVLTNLDKDASDALSACGKLSGSLPQVLTPLDLQFIQKDTTKTKGTK